MIHRISLMLAACLALAGAAAGAHHSFAVHFAGEELVTVAGVVTDFRFRNPHGMLKLRVAGEDGAVTEWRAETNSPNILNNGFNHSDSLHMIERFRLSSDRSTLWATQLYEDPETFSGPAARYMAWSRRPGEHVFPYECDPSYGE